MLRDCWSKELYPGVRLTHGMLVLSSTNVYGYNLGMVSSLRAGMPGLCFRHTEILAVPACVLCLLSPECYTSYLLYLKSLSLLLSPANSFSFIRSQLACCLILQGWGPHAPRQGREHLLVNSVLPFSLFSGRKFLDFPFGKCIPPP